MSKFIFAVQISGAQTYQMAFRPPAQGYFHNVTFKGYSNNAGSLNVIMTTQALEGLTEYGVVSNDVFIVPGTKGPHTYNMLMPQVENSVGDPTHFKKHFSQPLYVKAGKSVNLAVAAEDTQNIWLVIEGEFVPFKNSEWSFSWTFDEIATTTSYDQQYWIPDYLDDAIVELKGYATAASEQSGLLRMMYFNRDQQFDINEITGIWGGLDASITIGDEAHTNQNILEVIVASSQSGFAMFHGQGAISNRVKSGDRFAFDMEALVGASFTNFDVFVTIKGRVGYSRRFWKANYFAGPLVTDLNTLELGGVY